MSHPPSTPTPRPAAAKQVSYKLSSPSSVKGHGEDLERGPDHYFTSPPAMAPASGEKPANAHKEYRSEAPRPSMFARTFTQQFRREPLYGDESDDDHHHHGSDGFPGPGPGRGRRLVESKLKNHVVAALGEFVGTTMFLFFAFTGTGVAKIPAGDGSSGFDINQQMYIALAFGFSLMVNVWVFYRISGGLFNPAVTLALVLIRAITPARGAFVLVSQLLGGIAAAGLASCMFPTDLSVGTALAPGVSLAQGVFIEAVLTFELVFTIFMLAAEKHRATFVAPVGIGLALFIAEMSGVYYTGGSLNPARSLGPAVVAASFPTEHWIYWVGPAFGSLVAFGLYRAVKFMAYEGANPGQDSHE